MGTQFLLGLRLCLSLKQLVILRCVVVCFRLRLIPTNRVARFPDSRNKGSFVFWLSKAALEGLETKAKEG